jgi:hypothetical protein
MQRIMEDTVGRSKGDEIVEVVQVSGNRMRMSGGRATIVNMELGALSSWKLGRNPRRCTVYGGW